jgi:hypothetical protein
MTRVTIPGGPAFHQPERRVEHPTWTWHPGYGFLFDEPTPTPPRDTRREGRR